MRSAPVPIVREPALRLTSPPAPFPPVLVEIAAPLPEDELLAVNEALDLFSQHALHKAELVKLRYFAGLTNEEVSQVLGISVSTAKNYWTFSRAWLLNEIEGQ